MESPRPGRRGRRGTPESEARARSATSDDLFRILMESREEEILLAGLENPNLTEGHILRLARRRTCPGGVLEEIATNHRWFGNYLVKLELARNPRTPHRVSLGLIKYLYRLDLAKVARDVSVPMPIRQLCQHTLETRLSDLTMGEKAALAYEAPAPVLRIILEDPEATVFEACLKNQRLSEAELIRVMNRPDVSGEKLRVVASNDKWCARYPVRRALVENPKTPMEVRQELLPSILKQDLVELMSNPALETSLRKLARSCLERRVRELPLADRKLMAGGSSERLSLDVLLDDDDPDVVRRTFGNPNLLMGHVVSFAARCSRGELLAALAESQWGRSERVQHALFNNPYTPPELQQELRGSLFDGQGSGGGEADERGGGADG